MTLSFAGCRNPARAGCAIALLFAAGAVHGADDAELGNWFNDPFIQVRAVFPGCPMPLGPLLTRAEMRSQEHSRAERGTRCWLDGQCSKPNSYLYDADIANELAQRFRRTPRFARDALWVTVRRRFVWVEGCVRQDREARSLEALARGVPDVQAVIVSVTSAPASKLPYETLEARRQSVK